jgi:NAD(P)H-hydrate repair Nnr-like enzyme with NAD(P)H-hydrate dehydratase domain
MVKYTPATYAKALTAFAIALFGALTTASHGQSLGSLDLGQWILAAGTALTAGAGVFAVPNKATNPVDVAVSQVEKATRSVQKAQNNAPDEGVERIKNSVENLAVQVGVGAAQVGGTIVDELIDRVRRTR